MSSSRAEPRSIESKLVLFFIPAAALLLCCGLGIFYWMMLRHAYEEDNAVLADKLFALKTDLTSPDGIKLVSQELTARQGGEHAAYFIRIIDSHGSVVAETPRMSDLLPQETFQPLARSTSSALKPKTCRPHGKLLSLVTDETVIAGNRYIIQLAQDRSSDEEVMRKFGILLVSVIAVGIVAAAVISIKVTRRGLRPLGEMADALERIGPTHFNERIIPSRWPRELQPLAHAFDQMLDRLENSFTRLSQFSADLAHELRTPIANILGEGQVALTRDRTSEEYREVVESTVAECERLSGIVDNLLFLARAEGVEKQVNPQRFDARPAIEKIAAYYQTLAEDRQIAIRCQGEGRVFADPILFDRALTNLVDNALRHTAEKGAIQIAIATHNKHTEISVADNGAGIPSEHLPRVFDRFYRADPSRSTQGTGLGLSIVKSIVDLHGGSAAIRSEPGKGATVTLSFPDNSQA